MFPSPLFALALFFLGASVGSFLHVLTLRSLAGKSWVKGRSRCDHCHKNLFWWELVPVISFLMLKSRCSKCKKKIALSHFLTEVGCGVWTVVVFAIFPAISTLFSFPSFPLLMFLPFWWIVGLVCACIVVADLKKFIIPDWTVVTLGILAVVRLCILNAVDVPLALKGQIVEHAWAMFLSALLASGFFFLLWHFTKGRGMGFGDVKLAAVLGLLFEWPSILILMYTAFLSGSVIGVAQLLLGRAHKKHIIPFGPFLILGAMVTLIWGSELMQWWANITGLSL